MLHLPHMGFRTAPAAIALLLAFVATPAFADGGRHYCDSTIKADLINQSHAQYGDRTEEIDDNWQEPNSIDNSFCGGSFYTNLFNQRLNASLNVSLMGWIQSFLTNQASQICQQAISSVMSSFNSAANATNACSTQTAQTVNSTESALQLIQRLDPNYLQQVYANPNYNDCYLAKAIDNWMKLHPNAR